MNTYYDHHHEEHLQSTPDLDQHQLEVATKHSKLSDHCRQQEPVAMSLLICLPSDRYLLELNRQAAWNGQQLLTVGAADSRDGWDQASYNKK